jgi:anti-anti-sigma regulatory factor
MPVTLQRQESNWLLMLEGRINVTSAAEVKAVLLEWLSAETTLELDLERAAEIDITILQLLWAAAREAARTGAKIMARVSDAAAMAARDSGFTQLPGFPIPE